jgi:hypothetical protein
VASGILWAKTCLASVTIEDAKAKHTSSELSLILVEELITHRPPPVGVPLEISIFALG